MPSGETGSPRTIPFNVAPRFGSLPESEISRIAFHRVGFRSDALQKVSANVVGEFSVTFE